MRIWFLLLMVISISFGIWETVDAVFFTPGIFDVAESYYFEFPLYAYFGFSFWGGLALLFALMTRKEWGYPLAFTYIIINFAVALLIGVVNILDETFMLKYLLAIAPPSERDIGFIAEYVAAPSTQLRAKVGLIVILLPSAYYLWLVRRNREYFCN